MFDILAFCVIFRHKLIPSYTCISLRKKQKNTFRNYDHYDSYHQKNNCFILNLFTLNLNSIFEKWPIEPYGFGQPYQKTPKLPKTKVGSDREIR